MAAYDGAGAVGEALGKPVVIENRGGGGGLIGTEVAAKAAPDGYTLLMCTIGTAAINEYLYKRLSFDPRKDFASVALVNVVANGIIVHPDVPARTLPELIALAKKDPGGLNYGTPGNGTSGHLCGEYLKSQAGIDMQHVPYRGSAAAFSDLATGRTAFQADTISFLSEHFRAGTVRGVVIATPERSPMAPDVPTSAEAGLPEYQATTWTPWSTTLGTPPQIRQFLYEQIAEALKTPAVRDRLIQLGNTIPEGMTPERTREFIASEIEKWVPIVRATGAKVD